MTRPLFTASERNADIVIGPTYGTVSHASAWRAVAAGIRQATLPDHRPMSIPKAIGWALATVGFIALLLLGAAVTP